MFAVSSASTSTSDPLRILARPAEANGFAGAVHPAPMPRLEEIAARVAVLSRFLGTPPRTAKGAVAMILRGTRGRVEVLLIERAEREGDPWSGQIAFPGGRRERTDRRLLDTARRETKEEIGLSLARDARLLGWLPWRAPANRVDWIVVPYVFAVRGPVRPSPTGEVARAFWARLDALPAGLRKTVIEFPDGDLEVPAFDVGGKPLWGFTFRVLCDLFDLLGWPDSGAPRGGQPGRTRVGLTTREWAVPAGGGSGPSGRSHRPRTGRTRASRGRTR